MDLDYSRSHKKSAVKVIFENILHSKNVQQIPKVSMKLKQNPEKCLRSFTCGGDDLRRRRDPGEIVHRGGGGAPRDARVLQHANVPDVNVRVLKSEK